MLGKSMPDFITKIDNLNWKNGSFLLERMDSISGSLKQSEPCSPNSPGSPDPMIDRRPNSPNAISTAISNLQRSKIFHVFYSWILSFILIFHDLDSFTFDSFDSNCVV